jgi:hypothetical protein
MVAMAGVVVAVIALAVFVWRSGARPATGPPAVTLAGPTAPAATGPSEPPGSMPADSLALTSPQPALPVTTLRRYAQTWVNVRGQRRVASPVIRVLNPGEGVQVDSLQVGWYRVVVDGRPGGYVHRSNLGTAPPPTLP